MTSSPGPGSVDRGWTGRVNRGRGRAAAFLLLALVESPTLAARLEGSPSKSSPKAAVPSVALLPSALRSEGAEILATKDDDERAQLVADLAEEDPQGTETFLISLLDHDGAAVVRREVVDQLRHQSSAASRRALERHAASDPSADVSLLALESLRETAVGDLRRVLAKRMSLARTQGDTDAIGRLASAEERWISLVRGTMLPSFLRQPPGDFAVTTKTGEIRVVLFGDFGDGSESQRKTAAAIQKEHSEKPFDFGLTLGDNFYESGSESPTDPRWKTWWEDLYGPLGIRFYATLGNHDWKLSDSPAAEILYKSESWSMPSPYYTFTAGEAQFFGVDTNEVSEEQLAWLKTALEKSAAKWKVVYGHHPIYSAGQHGDTKRLVDRLLPVLRDRADAYFCGHDHDMQHLKPDAGVHFFVAGSGGAHQRPMHPHPRTLFARTDVHGFAELEITGSHLTVRFVDVDGSTLYEFVLDKPAG